MPEDVDLIVASTFHPDLLRLIHKHMQLAIDRTRIVHDDISPSGQSRQAIGKYRRLRFLTTIREPGAALGLEVLSVNRNLQVIPVHEEVVSIDLLRVGRVYLWLTRIRHDGVFAVRPAKSVKALADEFGIVRPLFNDPDGSIILPMFFELDASDQVVERVGIGLPCPQFRRVGQEIIPSFLVYANRYDAANTAAAPSVAGDRRHGVEFRTPDVGGPTEAGDADAGTDSDT